jgi:hypothetical protein
VSFGISAEQENIISRDFAGAEASTHTQKHTNNQINKPIF